MSNDVFVNPYAFIQLPKEKKLFNVEEYGGDKHTGYIEYTITTKTPLFIPNSSSEKAFKVDNAPDEHKSYDFFSYTDLKGGPAEEPQEPVIPGSEIRGVVRNVYETLTNSCMSSLNENEQPFKRIAGFKPALLHRTTNGKFELLEANKNFRIYQYAKTKDEQIKVSDLQNDDRIFFVTPKKGEKTLKNGKTIYYDKPIVDWGIIKNNDFNNCGCLIKWRMGGTKKNFHVYTLDRNSNNIIKLLTNKEIEVRILHILDSYIEGAEAEVEKSQEKLDAERDMKLCKEYRNNLKDFLACKTGDYFPINYCLLEEKYEENSDEKNPDREKHKELLQLAPAIYSKERALKTIGEYAGEFAPCKGDTHCPACELFGYVSTGNGANSAKGSKIRFSDLYVKKDEKYKYESHRDYYNPVITLPILGEPKLGNVDFYLFKPEGSTYWSYDYYVIYDYRTKKGDIHVGDCKLSGRKYYWHSKSYWPYDISKSTKTEEATNMNKTIRPLKANVKFTGKLYFEGISDVQIKQLVAILNSGKDGLGLKLGGAKPLGYGSISCKVDKVMERKIEIKDMKITYDLCDYKFKDEKAKVDNITIDNACFTDCKLVKDEFKIIAGLNSISDAEKKHSIKIKVTYPKLKVEENNPRKDKDKEPVSEICNWHGNNRNPSINKREGTQIFQALPTIENALNPEKMLKPKKIKASNPKHMHTQL